MSEGGYECRISGRTIRAWEKDGTVYVCLADIFMCLDLEEQKIDEEPIVINGEKGDLFFSEICVTHKCFMQMLENSTVAKTAGTPANELKRYLWSVPSPQLGLRA